MRKPSEKAIESILVVLSGGQDSCTCLFDAIHRADVIRVEAVSFDYGQRHARELDSAAFVYELARREAARVDVVMPDYRTVKRMRDLFEGNSPLTAMGVDLETYASVDEMDAKIADRIEATFVPGRNAAFLTFACSYAVARGIDAVMTGVNGADNANYPDCTVEFITSMETTAQLATRSKVRILTPLQGMQKRDIVKHAEKLGTSCMKALAFTMTDYAGDYPPGDNHASVLRAHGFRSAGRIDPLLERARAEGLLP